METTRVIIVLYLCFQLTTSKYLTGYNYLMDQFRKSAKSSSDQFNIKTKMFEQPIDHFKQRKNSGYWNMMYYENLDKWRPGKPVYIFIGGEEPLDNFCLQTGLIYELAEETHGAMFATEHRYYGTNRPFKDVTVANLRFLSSRQALEDIANFITHIIKQSTSFSGSKVVVIGGSYAGNLAAWMRLRYPHLVDAAISSSAPILAKLDFFEFFETVGDDFKNYSQPKCFKYINQAIKRYSEAFNTENGIEPLKKKKKQFPVCPKEFYKAKKKINQQLFFFMISCEFAAVTQFGTPTMIEHFCQSPFQNYDESDSCHKCNFNDCFNKKTNLSDPHTLWLYQMCSEFGYFMTAPKNQPFASMSLGSDFYIKICKVLFGKKFSKRYIRNAVKKTNNMYGGLRPNLTNVIFVHGEIDPWRKLGVTTNLSETVPAWVIANASHCNDLLPNLYENKEVSKIKNKEKAFLKNLLDLTP